MLERSRAILPETAGYVERGGVKVHYEVCGAGSPAVLLLPTWSIVHSRSWKAQIPFLARHTRLVVFDPRGNGRSDRPSDPAAYAEREFAADALAVLDATGTDRAFVVGHSQGAQRGLILAAEHPDRVLGLALIAPAVPVGAQLEREAVRGDFDTPRDSYEEWERYNRHYWSSSYPEFLDFFFEQCQSEPHSTKQREDMVGYGLDTDAATLTATALGDEIDAAEATRLAESVRCPVLVIHGTDDRIRSLDSGRSLAALTGGRFVSVDGAGHGLQARMPVLVNRLLGEFIGLGPPDRPRRTRSRRVLFVSSPIGLGHARRDLAIADELRALHPGLRVEWLAQDPVTRALEARGETIHPASRFLASESAHIESEAHEHDLHAFQAIRHMDEILVANFMVFDDLVREEQFDAWVGDEAWELDHFLHEHPRLKRSPFAWLTDFVGWLPMPEGGEREVALTADYNAEMIDHISRHPGVRDRSIFVGNPADVVPDGFGPDLPLIRDWTAEHFAFPGYVTGFAPVEDRAALRAELGYAEDEQVCLVTVGGSGVGEPLLRRVASAYALAKERLPALRMVIVAGPRIDPRSLSSPAFQGVEVHGYVPGLYRHLAACDIAVVQGGLTTCMELTANRRPFLYFPLRRHFEQTFHVHHRLSVYGAGRRMDYATDGPEEIAEALAEELGRTVDYRTVEDDGARRAAALVSELL